MCVCVETVGQFESEKVAGNGPKVGKLWENARKGENMVLEWKQENVGKVGKWWGIYN